MLSCLGAGDYRQANGPSPVEEVTKMASKIDYGALKHDPTIHRYGVRRVKRHTSKICLLSFKDHRL